MDKIYLLSLLGILFLVLPFGFWFYIRKYPVEKKVYSPVIALGGEWLVDTSTIYLLNYSWAALDHKITKAESKFYSSRETKEGFVFVYRASKDQIALETSSNSETLVQFVLVEDVQNWQKDMLLWYEKIHKKLVNPRPLAPEVYVVPTMYLATFPTG